MSAAQTPPIPPYALSGPPAWRKKRLGKRFGIAQAILTVFARGLFAAVMVVSPLWAAEKSDDTWRAKSFSYVAGDQDIVSVMEAFGAVIGLSVVVSPEVKGTISGNFEKVSPESFLESLSAAHGLVWYCDGACLYVYASREMDSQLISLEYLKPDEAVEMVKQLNIYDPRYSLRSLADPPMIHVVGPPRYLENITAVLQAAEEQLSRREVRQEEVRLFELKHAWADDIRLPLREGEVSIPGVATTLRRLMISYNETLRQPRDIQPGPDSPAGKINQTPLIKPLQGYLGEQNAGATPESGAAAAPEEIPSGTYEYGTPTHMRNQLTQDVRPSIEADIRRNAVIVRDSAERMRMYEKLILQLDIPIRMVEIQASILDVNADIAFEWGLNTSFSYEDHRNSGAGSLTPIPGAVGNDVSGNVGAMDVSWLLIGDHLRFLTAVRALEGKGQARILSRPSLITFANLEAELRDDQTYNVRVAGKEVAELYSVTAGVQLRVTANIIEPPAGEPESSSGVQLLVHIEDGSFDETKVDGLPIVRTSALNTQAVVGHGQSLLVGGYLKDSNTINNRDVPVASKVPILGALFKSSSRRQQVMQRMFLLTPRIVELDAAMGLDPLEGAKRVEAEKRLFNLLDRQIQTAPKDAISTKKKESSKKSVSRERAPESNTVEVAPAEPARDVVPAPEEALDTDTSAPSAPSSALKPHKNFSIHPSAQSK